MSFYFSGLPESEFAYYGSGFHESAKSLVRSLRRRGGFREVDALPALFLYRHTIELDLKAIIILGEGLLWSRVPSRFRDLNHDLNDLLVRVERVLAEQGVEWWWPRAPIKTWNDVKDFVAYLSKCDQQATAFRYPIERSGRRSLPSSFEVGFFALAKALDTFATSLDCVETGLANV